MKTSYFDKDLGTYVKTMLIPTKIDKLVKNLSIEFSRVSAEIMVIALIHLMDSDRYPKIINDVDKDKINEFIKSIDEDGRLKRINA